MAAADLEGGGGGAARARGRRGCPGRRRAGRADRGGSRPRLPPGRPPPGQEDDQEADAAEPSNDPFAYPGLGSVEVRLASGPVVRIPGRAAPDAPGPVAGRPGSGGKGSLDLSNLYTPDGLLGDSDNNEIPDRVDALLAPGTAAVEALPDLAARLGLESTGLVVPLVEPAAGLDRPASRPTLVLAGTENPLTQQLADSGRVDLAGLQAGEGLIQLVPDAFGSKPSLVVTGGDAAGARRALDHLALTLPHLDARGDDRPTLDHVEQALWSALSGRSPAGQAAIGLYKLDRILTDLAGRDLAAAEIPCFAREAPTPASPTSSASARPPWAPANST